jgi:hypothetical protein
MKTKSCFAKRLKRLEKLECLYTSPLRKVYRQHYQPFLNLNKKYVYYRDNGNEKMQNRIEKIFLKRAKIESRILTDYRNWLLGFAKNYKVHAKPFWHTVEKVGYGMFQTQPNPSLSKKRYADSIAKWIQEKGFDATVATVEQYGDKYCVDAMIDEIDYKILQYQETMEDKLKHLWKTGVNPKTVYPYLDVEILQDSLDKAFY